MAINRPRVKETHAAPQLTAPETPLIRPVADAAPAAILLRVERAYVFYM